ncbi:relaxase/mobilization nuclease domain-containing protein [Flavobacterium terrigena]|uniref:Relaxase/Mobilisation nuclease domain-containing protein n=1 Tax=Flavobacterium terrigena TaxID=402734 RepID=A0A1H6SDC3_9FLAO|nr:relaxase/mobilization nuclease domain-containing protein [Flavobacterium terrigena]SEI63914.1 Relaxase/Mobilisation nuclease domain-containing protein [Flavobacterium terrigena]
MISKQIKGKDFYGVLMYNEKKINAGVGTIIDTNINMGTVIQQTKEFNLVRQLKPNLSKAVYHTSLNLPYSDKLSDEEFSNLARDYLEGMGFDDNQYVVYRHTDQDHAHIHLVANRVKFSGDVVSDSQDYKRSEALVRKLEEKFNLTQLIPKQESNVLSKGEIEKCLRTGNVPERLEFQNIIFEILNQNVNLKDFVKKLKGKGVQVKLNQSSTGYISGISFEFKAINYKGSDVHKKLSWNNIKIKLNNYEQIRDHSIVPEVTTGNRANEKRSTGVEKSTIEIAQDYNRHSSDIRQEDRQINKITNKPKFRQ